MEKAIKEPEQNKMGIMPVKKLIISMSVPMMISMMVQALYNIVDSIFVAKLSEDALSALTAAYPLQMFMISVGSGTGVGMNAILSKALGAKNTKKVNEAANMGIFLTILSYFAFVIVGIFASRPFIMSQVYDKATKTYNLAIADLGTTYIKICCVLSFGIFFQMIFERLLQSTGQTIYSMVSQITGAIVNIIFDPILIFGLLGAPKMGVAGAAYATVLGQVVAACVGLVLNIKVNKEITLSIREIFAPKIKTIGMIYAIGIPSIVMMSIGSIKTYLMNRILITFSSTAMAVFGAYFKLQSIIFMPIFGLNNGVIPVLAFNFGAREKKRINDAIFFAMKMAFGIMVFGFVIFQVFPKQLLKLFSATDEMLRIGTPALRIISIHFPIAAICIILGSTFQAFAKSNYSLTVSVMRQLVVLIPAAWLLAQTGKVELVWFAFPIAEIASLTTSLLFYRRIKRKIIDNL